MELFQNLATGFGVAFTFQNLIYCFVGCLLGTLIGVLPGIGPVATIAMLLPATYALPPVAALIMLAIQAAGTPDRAAIQAKLLDVANAPGERIYPGELGKALKILATGGEVDYVGATNVELDAVGEASGSYKELEVMDGKFATKSIR